MKEDQTLRRVPFRSFSVPDGKDRLMEKNQQKQFSVKNISIVGILCAIAYVAKLISTVFPQVAGFLSFDLKDVVIVIGGFMMGPVTAAVITLVVSLVEMVTVSTTGPIGFLMNVLASGSFACIASIIYKRKHDLRGAILGLVLGTVCMTAVMLLWNWLITPLYMKVDRSVVTRMLIPVFLPFNLVKGGINATLTLLLYKPVVTALRKAHLLSENTGSARETKWGLIAASGVLLVSFVLLALALAGKL